MGDCLHTVHTERDQAAGPDAEHTEGPAQDPGHGTALRLGAAGREGHERGGLLYLLTAYLVVMFC